LTDPSVLEPITNAGEPNIAELPTREALERALVGTAVIDHVPRGIVDRAVGRVGDAARVGARGVSQVRDETLDLVLLLLAGAPPRSREPQTSEVAVISVYLVDTASPARSSWSSSSAARWWKCSTPTSFICS